MNLKRSIKGVQIALTNEEADMMGLICEAHEYMPVHRQCGAPSLRLAIELKNKLKESKNEGQV